MARLVMTEQLATMRGMIKAVPPGGHVAGPETTALDEAIAALCQEVMAGTMAACLRKNWSRSDGKETLRHAVGLVALWHIVANNRTAADAVALTVPLVPKGYIPHIALANFLTSIPPECEIIGRTDLIPALVAAFEDAYDRPGNVRWQMIRNRMLVLAADIAAVEKVEDAAVLQPEADHLADLALGYIAELKPDVTALNVGEVLALKAALAVKAGTAKDMAEAELSVAEKITQLVPVKAEADAVTAQYEATKAEALTGHLTSADITAIKGVVEGGQIEM